MLYDVITQRVYCLKTNSDFLSQTFTFQIFYHSFSRDLAARNCMLSEQLDLKVGGKIKTKKKFFRAVAEALQ